MDMDGYGLSVAGPGTLTEKRHAIAPVAGRTAVGAVVCVGTGVSAYRQLHEFPCWCRTVSDGT